jgi:hypothetical protein
VDAQQIWPGARPSARRLLKGIKLEFIIGLHGRVFVLLKIESQTLGATLKPKTGSSRAESGTRLPVRVSLFSKFDRL